MRKLFNAALVLTLVSSLMACNTIAGVGKDLRNAGSAIEGVAEKNKKDKKD